MVYKFLRIFDEVAQVGISRKNFSISLNLLSPRNITDSHIEFYVTAYDP